jgi:hypothetical protein
MPAKAGIQGKRQRIGPPLSRGDERIYLIRSHRAVPTVNQHVRTGHEGRCIARQKHRRRRDLVGLAEAAEQVLATMFEK